MVVSNFLNFVSFTRIPSSPSSFPPCCYGASLLCSQQSCIIQPSLKPTGPGKVGQKRCRPPWGQNYLEVLLWTSTQHPDIWLIIFFQIHFRDCGIHPMLFWHCNIGAMRLPFPLLHSLCIPRGCWEMSPRGVPRPLEQRYSLGREYLYLCTVLFHCSASGSPTLDSVLCIVSIQSISDFDHTVPQIPQNAAA